MENESRKDLSLYKRLLNIESILKAYKSEKNENITAKKLAEFAPNTTFASVKVDRENLTRVLGSGHVDMAFDVALPIKPPVLHTKLIDDEFFALFSRLAEAALMGGDKNAAQSLRDLQDALLEHSSMGAKVKAESEEIQAARQTLEELGEELTREKLLDLILAVPNESRLRAYVQMTRPGMDYQFFQLLTEKIDQTQGDEKNQFLELREKLLEYTDEIDEVVKQRMQLARQNLDALLQVENIEATLQANMAAVDEFFFQVLTESLEAARESGDLDRSGKLQQIMTTIEKQAAAPPEYELIDELMGLADDEDALRKVLGSQADEVNAKLLEIMNGLMAQLQASVEGAQSEAKEQQQEMLNALQKVYNATLRLSMEKSFSS